jgi:hypothetical protein
MMRKVLFGLSIALIAVALLAPAGIAQAADAKALKAKVLKAAEYLSQKGEAGSSSFHVDFHIFLSGQGPAPGGGLRPALTGTGKYVDD